MMALPALFSSTAMSAIGAAVLAASAIYRGQVAKSEANAQANIADQNARTARLQAGVREDLIRRQNRAKLGEQRAAVEQSGFDPNTGSLLELQGDSAAAGEFDALTTRYEGALQALSFSTQADSLRRSGKAAARTGFLNAAGTLLSSFGSKYGGGGNMAPVETRIIPRG
jgi:hypothetical protein